MITTMAERVCHASYLEVVPYDTALIQQEEKVQARSKKLIPDTLILLQHPHVITTGRFCGDSDILAPRHALSREGIEVFSTSRGGNVTYHGPGQLVGYPIIDLQQNRLGARQYIWCLEEVIIRVLSVFGIESKRKERYPGVWVEDRKICSIGVRVVHHITMHGFALNVNCDLRYFRYINPCGLSSSAMTSIARELKTEVAVETVVRSLVPVFADVFGTKCEMRS